MSTQSFYPPHHLTMGEGGAVNICGSLRLQRPAESLRDWGRDCYCPTGKDNTCGKRFSWQLGDLPSGYDHKFIYSHLGYNLKPLEIQAAIGRIQMERLENFSERRKQNWQYLRKGLSDLDEFLDFALPEHATGWNFNGFSWDKTNCQTDCSWFGFMIKIRKEAPFLKTNFSKKLVEKKIGNRMLFGGNLTKQPVFIKLKNDNPNSYRVVGNLNGADQLMNQALFLGTYPGLNNKMLDYEIETIHDIVKNFTK
jgi:Predicted pyridoxal phosphate-dependent enzyme apparently involved in regulation of cell wall biogenesis